MTVEDRAREVVGRALDALVVDPVPVVVGEPPAPDRGGRGWGTWAVAVGAVAAAVAGFVLLVPDGGGAPDEGVAAAIAPPPCDAVVAHGPDDETVIDAGPLPDGHQWQVVLTGAPPNLALWAVVPGLDNEGRAEAGVPAFHRGGLSHDASSWPHANLVGDFSLAVTNVPGGYVVVAEVPPDTARIEVVDAGGLVASACARSVAGVDGIDRARYAGTFFTATGDDPPTFQAHAADGRLLADATTVPDVVWRATNAGGGTNWRLVAPLGEPGGPTTTTATTAPSTRPPVPSGNDPCGDEPPPFTVEDLPDGIEPTPVRYRAWRESQTPPGDESAPELYDPVFTFLDPDDPERRIDVFHGNSWRLDLTLRRQDTILGRDAWLSDLTPGHVLIDFQLDGSGDPCDFWGLRNAGSITEAELVAAAESLRYDGG